MAINIQLKDFSPKTAPIPADLVYLANSQDSYNEVKSTIAQLIGAYPSLLSMASLTTAANQFLYTTAEDIWEASSISAFGRSLVALSGANSSVIVTDETGAVSMSSSLTDGQLLIGVTAGKPIPATLTAGPGISIANAAGAITISGTGSGIGWTEVTGTTQAMVADNGYVANNGALVEFTLPATAAFGTVINLVGKGAGGWLIAQNAGQNIQIGSVSSTVGVGGSVASSNRFDSLELLCTTADTTWTILGGGQSAGFIIL